MLANNLSNLNNLSNNLNNLSNNLNNLSNNLNNNLNNNLSNNLNNNLSNNLNNNLNNLNNNLSNNLNNNVKNDVEYISDPKKFGPGMWYSIHTTALRMGEDNFIDWIVVLISRIPCLDCRGHATEYLNKNPPSMYKGVLDENTGEIVGMFKWTYIFHNAVNARLGKRVIDYIEAYNIYSDDSACSSKCGQLHSN